MYAKTAKEKLEEQGTIELLSSRQDWKLLLRNEKLQSCKAHQLDSTPLVVAPRITHVPQLKHHFCQPQPPPLRSCNKNGTLIGSYIIPGVVKVWGGTRSYSTCCLGGQSGLSPKASPLGRIEVEGQCASAVPPITRRRRYAATLASKAWCKQ